MAESEASSQLFTNGLYDRLKFISLVLLPALGALYFGLAQFWGLPNPEEVVGSITVLDTFLGVLLNTSTNKYYKSGANFDGDVTVLPEDGGNKVVVGFNNAPEDIVDTPGKHSVELQIRREQ